MPEPWKTILCDSEQCIGEMSKPNKDGSLSTSLDEGIIEEYRIYPDIDNEVMVQFTCPRCNKVQTWGVTRMQTAKILYERYNK